MGEKVEKRRGSNVGSFSLFFRRVLAASLRPIKRAEHCCWTRKGQERSALSRYESRIDGGRRWERTNASRWMRLFMRFLPLPFHRTWWGRIALIEKNVSVLPFGFPSAGTCLARLRVFTGDAGLGTETAGNEERNDDALEGERLSSAPPAPSFRLACMLLESSSR